MSAAIVLDLLGACGARSSARSQRRPPPYTPDWAETLGLETLLDAAGRHFIPTPIDGFRAGDVLVFRFRDHLPAKHLGIATSAAHMTHAHSGACVAEVGIAPWRKRLAAAFAFPGVSD